MPISPIVLQRRHAELGRIRLGDKGDRGQPQKLSQFRFTSPSEAYIKDLAELYGGTPQPWDNGGVPGFEVYTTATSIPVYVVKNGLSQWLEYWQGGGCIHRCDGESNVLTGEPCDLEEQVKTRVRGQDVWINPHTEAKPTTRLSVMLPELEAVGVFRMESHGWNAAAEIPAVAELSQFVGDIVPAVLHLQERRAIKDGKTSRFVVPVLDLKIGTARLREIVAQKSGATTPELEAPASSAPAIEAPKAAAHEPESVRTPTPEQIAAATSREVLDQMWRDVAGHQHQDRIREAIVARITELQQQGLLPSGQEAQPDADGVVDAVLVDEPSTGSTSAEVDADVVWQQILKAGGERGMTLGDVEDDVRTFLGGMSSAEASGAELAEYLTDLQGRPETLAVPA